MKKLIFPGQVLVHGVYGIEVYDGDDGVMSPVHGHGQRKGPDRFGLVRDNIRHVLHVGLLRAIQSADDHVGFQEYLLQNHSLLVQLIKKAGSTPSCTTVPPFDYARNEGKGKVVAVGRSFASQDYCMAIPQGSPLREDLNRVLLNMMENGSLERIRSKWFGAEP